MTGLLLGWWGLFACSPTPQVSTSPEVVFDRPVATGASGPDLVMRGDRLAWSWTERHGEVDQAHLAVYSAAEGLVTAAVPSEDVVVGLARKPSIALDDDGTVYLTFTSGDPRSSTLWLATAPPDLSTVDVQALATAGAGSVPTLLDQPEVRVAPDGRVWVMTKAEVDHPTVELWLGTDDQGFAFTPVTPFPGRPCECCPHQLDFTAEGDALLTIRNDENNLREIWVARADAGTTGFDRVQQASSTGWVVQGCPFDGPRLAATDDPELWVTWVDATQGPARAWLARSDDGGARWGPEQPLFEGLGTAFGTPLVAAHDGTLWVAAEELWDGLAVARDRGAGWEAVEVRHVRQEAELVAGEAGVFLIGLDDDRALWVEPL